MINKRPSPRAQFCVESCRGHQAIDQHKRRTKIPVFVFVE
jgi:hypothetical protein